jgi:hypothetical protein
MRLQSARAGRPPLAAPVRSRPAAGLAHGWPGVAVVSFLATVLGWRPYAWHSVYAGIDPSWEAGLAMGFMRHLQWGPSLIFTYGPYGFVDGIYPFYRLTAFISVLFAIAVVWGLAALIVAALRPSWGLLAAGVAAWAALAIVPSKTGYSDVAAGTALGLALAALAVGHDARHGRTAKDRAGQHWAAPDWAAPDGAGQEAARAGQDRVRLVLVGLLAVLAGFQLMVKTNQGLLTIGLLVVVVALGDLDWRRAAPAAGAALVVAFFAGWLAAGQSLTNIASYFRGSLSVALGYSSAMQVSQGRGAENWYAVVVCGLLVILFALSVLGKPGRYQVAVGLVVAGWLWAEVKEGFVRHDEHDLTFFGLALAAMLLARLPRRYVPLQAGAFVVTAIIFCVAYSTVPLSLHSPGATTSAFFDDVGEVLGFGGFGHARAETLNKLLSTGDALPPATLSLLEGHTVAVEPIENSIVYDYPQLRWDPEPVLQGYSAYTSYLDRLDAAFLASPRAPERILYQPWARIDYRDQWLDPPATLESMYCHYLQLPAPGPAQVLERVPNRCSAPVEVGRLSVPLSGRVTVPREPGEMVVATFSFGLPLRDKAEGILLKPPTMRLVVWTSGARPAFYRFVPGTAADDHVLSVPATLGYSPAFTPPDITKFTISGGGWEPGHGKITVTFYAVAVRP